MQVAPIELMVHRRLFRDDGLGVGENLNEMEYDTRRNVFNPRVQIRIFNSIFRRVYKL